MTAPDGWFVMSNFFRWGWLVARLQAALHEAFDNRPEVFTLPYEAEVQAEQEFRGFNDVARRSVFLVDESATIRAVWKYENSELPDVDELLAACRALQPSH